MRSSPWMIGAISGAACGSAPRPAAPAPPEAWVVRYDAHHRGDHPDADFTITQWIERTTEVVRGRLSVEFRGSEFATGTVEIDAATGAPRAMHEVDQGSPAIDVVFTGGTAQFQRGTRRATFTAEHLAGDVSAFELALVVGELHSGDRRAVDLVDVEREALRQFEVTVGAETELVVPAGTFCALPVTFASRDGDARLSGTYHFRCEAPHLVLRRDYVVFPETVAEDAARPDGHRRSHGVEELVELRF